MTPPGPTVDGLPPDARWCAAVASALAGASTRAGRLALAIADDWRDERGQEWVERTALLHRELGRVAAEAAEAATALINRREDAAAAVRDRGPRLGIVAGERADPGLGMRIAELPDPP